MKTWKFVLSFAFASLPMALHSEPVEPVRPFGEGFPNLDHLATSDWEDRLRETRDDVPKAQRKPFIQMDVPREEVVAFALYTHDAGVLKLSAQLFPLKKGESREVRLELQRNGEWQVVAKEKIVYPGWSAHFRIENWDATRDVPYRVRHGERAMFEGLIRRDPVEKKEIVVGLLSCNSTRTPGPRPTIVENLLAVDPDLLFFAGDQTYHHTQHTAGWLQFGLQFREIMKDRPTITIPDDHDVGQGNLWGEGGIQAKTKVGHDGGYVFPVEYVNLVERQQTWHLPDAFDPNAAKRGIGSYFTRLRCGGIDFAILEDRKFKSGPMGKIPEMGPRPDHINDPAFDRDAVDQPGLTLLGDRQLDFLHQWGQDWTGAEMKAVLSQTAFCGAVHLHGTSNDRLLADLDCNGWPQTGRRLALTEIRRAWAPHLCGDQHLAVSLKHGIDAHRDGPYAFTGPAIVNTIYGRWWHPEDEKPGPNPVPGSPLPWTGDYQDGLGNKITMLAYANPEDVSNEKKRGDGFGVVRFDKDNRTTVFECWPRFGKITDGAQQYPGWPISFEMRENDGRKPVAYLPKIVVADCPRPVIQVWDEVKREIVYTVRAGRSEFQPAVYALGTYSISVGKDAPGTWSEIGIEASDADQAGIREIVLGKFAQGAGGQSADAHDRSGHDAGPVFLASEVKFPPTERVVQLFNGKDLSGWRGLQAYFRVKDGEIVAANRGPVAASTYLFTEKSYRDFRLVFEVKQNRTAGYSSMHSAVAALGKLRIESNGPFGFEGPLFMFCNDWGIWDAHGRNRVFPPGQKAQFQSDAENVGDWNVVEILVTGNRLQMACNGKQIMDFSDDAANLSSSPIGLQLHANKQPQEFRFRNIRLSEAPSEELITVRGQSGD